MISVYLRNGDLAEVSAERVESRAWEFADGTSSSSLVCLDAEGEVVGQFLVDQVAGWMFSEDDDIFEFDDEDDEEE